MFTGIKRVAISSAIISPMLLGAVALGASSASAATTGHYSAAPASVAAATPPAVKIITKSAKAVYSPGKVTGKVISGTCSATNYSFLITNNTKASQQVTVSGSKLGGPIPKGQGLYICGTAAGKGTFSLSSNKKAKLLVTIS